MKMDLGLRRQVSAVAGLEDIFPEAERHWYTFSFLGVTAALYQPELTEIAHIQYGTYTIPPP